SPREQEEAMPERRGSTIIENVQPQLDGGRFPVKRVAGEPVRITADIFKEGHEDLAAVVRWRQLTPQATEAREEPMRFVGNDVWEADLPLTGHGFFFASRRRHTSSKRDWSSDVCSSDLDGLSEGNHHYSQQRLGYHDAGGRAAVRSCVYVRDHQWSRKRLHVAGCDRGQRPRG